jgi:hypothetical protein
LPPPWDPLDDLTAFVDYGGQSGTTTFALLALADVDGNIDYGGSVTYSVGTDVGTMTASQQVIASPALPLQILSPRTDRTNFMFDFVTVLNQSYTVLAKTNLASANWVSYTNLIGGGYMQKITVPLTDGKQNYFLLRSP